MRIQDVIEPQVMEDIPQEEVHPEEEDLQDHQEEDHLVHLKILDHQEIKDPKVPLDLKDIEDPQAHQGPVGPQGLLGQLVGQPCVPGNQPPPQVTMATSGLERTFLGMANAAERLARQQVVLNEQLNKSIREQRNGKKESKCY